MKKRNTLISLIAFAVTLSAAVFLLSGCLDVDTEVSVAKDGSGTVTQTFMMKKEFVDMIGAMQGDEHYSLLNEEELRQKKSSMGNGITFVKAEPTTKEGFSGYTVVYGFDDIEELWLNQNPGEDLPDDGSEGETIQEYIRFSYDRGTANTLTIFMPNQDFEAQKESSDIFVGEENETEFIEAFNRFYKDMKISMRITVDGRITNTDASYRDGSTVTLMEIDFSKFMNNPERIKEMARIQPDTMEELKQFMKDIPGMKAELKDELHISFR